MIARSLPHSIDWEIANEQLDISDTHRGRWRCDLKPIGRVDENLVAHLNQDAIANLGPERATNTTERNTNGC